MMPDFSKYDDYLQMTPDEFDSFDAYIPEEVCHYTKMQTALEKILSTRKIRLGEITSTNDPLETGKRRVDVFWGPPMSNKMFRSHEEEEWTKVRREWRVLCTSCHHDPSSHFMGKMENKSSDGINSSDDHGYGVSYSRMWAQYAENHSGICFLFDGKKLDNAINKKYGNNEHSIRHGFVRYNYKKSITNPLVDGGEFMSVSDEKEAMRRYLEKYYKNISFINMRSGCLSTNLGGWFVAKIHQKKYRFQLKLY